MAAACFAGAAFPTITVVCQAHRVEAQSGTSPRLLQSRLRCFAYCTRICLIKQQW